MSCFGNAARLLVCGSIFLHQGASAAETEVPEPFRGYDETSELEIDYENLSAFLGALVVDVGPSARFVAKPVRATTGTRMKQRIDRFTENEGNRFFYETLQDNAKAQQYLRNIQQGLEDLPSKLPLDQFSRDEQLAYWLNLYNVTVLNEVIAAYPRRNLKKLASGRNSIYGEKLLTVAGVQLSLDDIQYTILKQNYDSDPLILYGLYQGIVGGPDIRTTAFTGSSVYYDLEQNAFRFVNSNRGSSFRSDEDFFRVSSFYKRNRAFFPDFETDLTEHLLTFLEGPERDALKNASRIKPDIDNWAVTDFGLNEHRIAGSLADNQAAMLDAYKANRRSANGGIRTAMVVTMTIDDDSDEEDEVDVKDLERHPVDLGRVEDVVTNPE